MINVCQALFKNEEAKGGCEMVDVAKKKGGCSNKKTPFRLIPLPFS
jgi:hypothetical protein